MDSPQKDSILQLKIISRSDRIPPSLLNTYFRINTGYHDLSKFQVTTVHTVRVWLRLSFSGLC